LARKVWFHHPCYRFWPAHICPFQACSHRAGGSGVASSIAGFILSNPAVTVSIPVKLDSEVQVLAGIAAL